MGRMRVWVAAVWLAVSGVCAAQSAESGAPRRPGPEASDIKPRERGQDERDVRERREVRSPDARRRLREEMNEAAREVYGQETRRERSAR